MLGLDLLGFFLVRLSHFFPATREQRGYDTCMYMCVHVSLLSLSLFACLLRRWACGDGGARPSPPARKRYASVKTRASPKCLGLYLCAFHIVVS